jgi:DNA-binding transcriptional ArsR family regulator
MHAAFRALADPTRRAILEQLRDGPLTSGEIAQRYTTTWATVSRHLGVLTAAGLVQAERDGQNVRYALNTSVVQEMVQYLIHWTHAGSGNA